MNGNVAPAIAAFPNPFSDIRSIHVAHLGPSRLPEEVAVDPPGAERQERILRSTTRLGEIERSGIRPFSTGFAPRDCSPFGRTMSVQALGRVDVVPHPLQSIRRDRDLASLR